MIRRFVVKRLMSRKALGSILLILGTSIGAGMLALPIVSARETITSTLMMLGFSWLTMTVGALALLDVNLALKPGANLISMAELTFGRLGKVITWALYLLLLYSLLCAYLAGLSDILQHLLSLVHLNVPRLLTTLLALALFGSIVYRGIHSVDSVNRLLMATKLFAYLVIIFSAASYLNLSALNQGDYTFRFSVLFAMLTSFGFAIIVPSIRQYLDSNRNLLFKVVFFGSLLPLCIYAAWIVVIQGVLPKTGANGLIQMLNADNPNTLLMQTLGQLLRADWVQLIARVFISISALTSFLGVSLSLVDFIQDGLSHGNQAAKTWRVFGLAYLPPLLVVLFVPGIFITALDYAGVWCLLLLVILPCAMWLKLKLSPQIAQVV